eukprot:780212-Pleurochrysis_carterae.AAC.1
MRPSTRTGLLRLLGTSLSAASAWPASSSAWVTLGGSSLCTPSTGGAVPMAWSCDWGAEASGGSSMLTQS